MRIVTWNMNGWNRGRAHEKVWAFLFDTLDPDIALLQEAAVPDAIPSEYRYQSTPALPDARYGSMAHIEANPAHGIKSQPDPVPFNTPEEMQTAIEACLRLSKVVVHDPKGGAALEL